MSDPPFRALTARDREARVATLEDILETSGLETALRELTHRVDRVDAAWAATPGISHGCLRWASSSPAIRQHFRVLYPDSTWRTPEPAACQCSCLMTKYEPRMVPASFDFCRANLKDDSSSGTSMPSESLNPTARFPPSSSPYITLTERPLS